MLQRTTIHAISQFFWKPFDVFCFMLCHFQAANFFHHDIGRSRMNEWREKKVLSWHVPNSRKSLLIIPTFTYNLTIQKWNYSLFCWCFVENFRNFKLRINKKKQLHTLIPQILFNRIRTFDLLSNLILYWPSLLI